GRRSGTARSAGRNSPPCRLYFAILRTAAANRDLWRAALLPWINPLRAARSSSWAAVRYAAAACSAVVAARTRLSAVGCAGGCGLLRGGRGGSLRQGFLSDFVCGAEGSSLNL